LAILKGKSLNDSATESSDLEEFNLQHKEKLNEVAIEIFEKH
jgi:hypothetical protein